jgi:hypothetical protein
MYFLKSLTMQNYQSSNSSELILMLIKANLCNNKLIFGLEKAGVEAENFYGDLEDCCTHPYGLRSQSPGR